MKEKLTQQMQNTKASISNLMKKANEKEIFKGVLQGILIGAVGIAAVFLLMKALGYLFDAVYEFVDRHFFGVCATGVGASCIMSKHFERKAAKERLLLENQKGINSQKDRFNKGCYRIIGKFLFSEICTMPNFPDLVSCQRPIRPEDMGNASLDAYTYSGNLYNRFAIPKINAEPVDTALLTSIIQGMVDQKIKAIGLPPIIPQGDNTHLYVDKIEDMRTYISLTFVLDFDDNYLAKVAYENAMTEVLNRTSAERTLEDSDYHG